MKLKEERDILEELLNEASDKITDDVPTPGNIPEELQGKPIMDIDFTELKNQCNKEARIMINDAIGFILPPEMIKDNKYIANKLEVDIMSLAGMIYQLKVNEAMQQAMMEEVDRGFMQARMFEVFSGLSKTVIEINKQLLGTVEAIKSTYKSIKEDIREKQTDALGPASSPAGITQGDGSVITMGTKELINSVKNISRENSRKIDDVKEVS